MQDYSERNVVLTSFGLKGLRSQKFNSRETSTLWLLASKLSVSGEVISHVDVSNEVGIGATNIGPILVRLCKAGFLLRGPKVGRHYIYKLNPTCFRIIS